MDLDLMLKWGGGIGLLLSILNTAWVMAGRAAKPVTDRLDKHSADLKDHDRRIQQLENDDKHQPTGEQVTELRITAERLDGHVKRLDATVERLNHTVRRIDDYLRDSKL